MNAESLSEEKGQPHGISGGRIRFLAAVKHGFIKEEIKMK